MECPCEKCLVRPVCRSRVVKKYNGNDCLVIEYLEKCPIVMHYFTAYDKKITHEKICEVCKCMTIDYIRPYFNYVWYADTVREIN